MKAMILAAGLGKRLRPYTNLCPKPLLKVGEHRLIEYHLLALAKANITEVVINLHYLPELIENALGDGSKYGVNIYYTKEPIILDTAGGIINALPILGSEPFILISADIFTDYNLERLKEKKCNELAHLVLVENPSFHQQGDFSINKAGYIIEKNDISNNKKCNSYTYANIAIINPKIFSSVTEKIYSLGKLLHQYAGKNLISAELYHGVWNNVGTENELLALRRKLEQK